MIGKQSWTFFLIFNLAISCHHKTSMADEGFVKLIDRRYNEVARAYSDEGIMPDLPIWYRGNLVIEEIRTIKTTRTNGKRTRETPLAYYLFMDRESKVFYNYSSFSDTAKILGKYKQEDTAEIKGVGGWSFYRDHHLDIFDSLRSLSDTMIDNVFYKRAQFMLKGHNNLIPAVIYLRCDKKGTVFQFYKGLSEKLGCPIMRVDHLSTSKNPNPTSREIVFARDSLTKEELKVFDAWEKNLKKYPVKN